MLGQIDFERLEPVLRPRPVAVGPRLEGWQAAVSRSVVPVRCRGANRPRAAEGRIGSRALCRTAGLVLVQAGPHEVVGVPAPASDELMWIIQTQGAMQFAHGEVVAAVGAGEARLDDPCWVHRMAFSMPFGQLLFRFPRAWLENQRYAPGAGVDLRRGPGMLAWRHLSGLLASLDEMEAEEAEAAAAASTGLFMQAARPGGREPSVGSTSRLETVKRRLEPMISDPSLGPARAAAETGMSVRTLSNLFAREGDTLTRWLLRRRLDRAALDLRRDPSCSIAQVAFRWGFADQAHFTRSFRQRYGSTPRAFRQASLS